MTKIENSIWWFSLKLQKAKIFSCKMLEKLLKRVYHIYKILALVMTTNGAIRKIIFSSGKKAYYG